MKNTEIVTLNICEKGLNTYIHDWYIEEDVEYDTLDGEDIYRLKDGGYGVFEPNCTWIAVRVKRQDVDRYLDLYTEYLECSWTPNQDWDTQEENEKRIKVLKKKMELLEVTAVEKI